MSRAILATVQDEMRACRRCVDKGYPAVPPAVFSGSESARVMVVGQAPGVREVQGGRPFSGPSGRRLFRWLAQAGWEEDEFRAVHYMTAVTKCYPGKAKGGKGDRVPTKAEQRLCGPFLEQELALVAPEVIVPVGGLAAAYFLGAVRLADVVGQVVHDKAGHWIVPLPHPSGASLWLNKPGNQQRVNQALQHLTRLREENGL